jgi:hypothetical protein
MGFRVANLPAISSPQKQRSGSIGQGIHRLFAERKCCDGHLEWEIRPSLRAQSQKYALAQDG